MSWWAWTLIVLFVLWVLANMKRSRPDGTYLKTHPYRNMMFHLMPTANGSIVFFDDFVKVDKLLAFIKDANEHFHVDITHCVVAAATRGLSEVPKMNRFVIGRRLYQRKSYPVSFSMKRQKKGKKAKLAVVKTDGREGDTFRSLVQRINDKIGVERSDEKTYTDKELSLFLSLPGPILDLFVRLFIWLNHHNLLPKAFIDNDAFHCGIFVANLGSLGMGAGYHHLYEYGTCPLFLMIGQIEDRVFVEDGAPVVHKVMHFRFTYDERIDDGLNANVGIEKLRSLLEDPYTSFGDPGLPEDQLPLLNGQPRPEDM